MLRKLRPKLTFANVMVVVLTFIVLGGGAYAASSLPKNSVGTKQLKNGAVTQNKIAKAAQNALRGATGPQGPQGERGAKGEQGPKGTTGAAAVPGETIPVGATLRGAASTGALESGSPSGSVGSRTGVSFGGFQLPSRPVAHVIPAGGPGTAACPGSSAQPAATSGNLCIYITSSSPAALGQVIVVDPGSVSLSGVNFNLATNATIPFGDATVAKFGFEIALSTTGNQAELQATWAVTG
jgi:hypothetical protein